MRAVTILAAMAGCAEVPVYVPPVVAPLVTLNQGADVAVETESYRLVFGREGVVRMPVQLTVNTVEVMGAGGCPAEDRAGIGLEPVASASSSVADPSRDSEDFTIMEDAEDGAAVVVIGVTYNVPYACNDALGQAVVEHLRGESVFTMTANRINRRDLAVMPSMDMLMAGRVCTMCGGGMAAAADFSFRSYWRFEDMSTFRDRSERVLVVPGPASHETCVTAANQRLAVVWQAQPDMMAPELKQDVVAYRWVGKTTALAPEPRAAISNIAVGGSTCGEQIDDATDVTLLFNDEALEPSEDGVYRFTSVENSLEIRTAGAALHHAFAIEIPIEKTSIRHFQMQRNGKDTKLFQLQKLGSSGTLVWLYDGIGGDETVTIEFD